MSGPFDWGKDGKGTSSNKDGNLPHHIERMNMGTRPPKMKNSGDGNNLPWGGQPAEAKKAYMSGPPKNKGSILSKTGERTAKATALPGTGKAMSGYKPTIKPKAQPIKGMKKGK
jgi:hypothetical protein